ncbi:DUF2690 domain-containing protein [Streptomyces chartreusis]|nr:YjfA family protein [Streptomyces chartreusis]WTA32531.1 YjfA family protein [Streptomyces chartreusis]
MACRRDARTLAGWRTRAGAGLEIRFGARCDAAWTRIWQTRVGDRVEITAPGSPPPTGRRRRQVRRQGVPLHADGPGTTALGAARLPSPRPVTRAGASRLRASLSGWRRVPRGRRG